MAKEIFYTQNKEIFSNKITNIEYFIIEDLSKIKLHFNTKEPTLTNQKILQLLTKLENTKKQIQIRGIIQNQNKTINKIETKYKNHNLNPNKTINKIEIKPPENDNYEFISATSSEIILNQIEKKLKENKNFETIKRQIQKYLINITSEQKKQQEKISKEILKQKTIKEKSETKLKNYTNEQIIPQEKIIEKIKIKIENLRKQKKEIKKILNSKISHKKYEQKERAISQIEIKKDKIDRFDFQIKMTQEKVKILKEKEHLGVKKEINPTLLILTLGLSYYRKSNTIKYKIAKNLIHISNLKEKILNLEIKVKTKEKELEKIIQETTKNNEELEEIKITILELEKQFEQNLEKLEKIIPRQKTLEENQLKQTQKLKTIKEQKSSQEKYSNASITNKLKQLESLKTTTIQNIQKLKTQIKNQKTTINKSLIIKL